MRTSRRDSLACRTPSGPDSSMRACQGSYGAARGAFLSWLSWRSDVWGVAAIICFVGVLLHPEIGRIDATIALVTISATYWLAYAVNDFIDAASDSSDESKRRRNFFARRSHSPKWVLTLFSLVAGAVLLGFGSFGLTGVAFCFFCMICMLAYSTKPLRLRNRPGLDVIAHALLVQTFAYVMLLLLTDAAWAGSDYLLLGVFSLSSASGQLAQQERDLSADVASGARNFTTVFGRRVAKTVLRLVTGASVAFGIVGFSIGSFPLLIAPFGILFIWPAFRRIVGRVTSAYDSRPFTAAALVYVCLIASVFLAF